MRRTLLLTLSLVVAAVALPAGAAPQVERRAAPVHAVGGCELFPADNPWNRRIDGRPVWKQSRAIVAGQAAGHDLHLDLGTTEDYYGIPVNVVDEDQPLLPLQFGVDGEDYGDESDRGPVFVPADAAIEGGSTDDPDPDSGDRHVITVRRGTCDLVELYAAERVRDSSGTVVAWRAAAAARWDLSSNRLRPARWTSADAAGLPILPGLLSYEEAASGRITHALRFTLPSARYAYTWPARHCGPSGNTARDLPAYGMRFRLKKSFPTDPLHGRGQGRRRRDEALRAGLRRPGLGDVRHRHRGPALGRRPRPVPRAPARRPLARGREAVEAGRPLLTEHLGRVSRVHGLLRAAPRAPRGVVVSRRCWRIASLLRLAMHPPGRRSRRPRRDRHALDSA